MTGRRVFSPGNHPLIWTHFSGLIVKVAEFVINGVEMVVVTDGGGVVIMLNGLYGSCIHCYSKSKLAGSLKFQFCLIFSR